MTTENGGFDAGAMYDEGVEEAGIDPEEIATESPAGIDANVITQKDDSDTPAEGPEREAAAAETKAAEKNEPSAEEVAAAIEATKETEQQVESIISGLIPKPQEPEAAQTKPDFEPGKYVPVEDHIKLRQRAQAAESKVEQFERERLETSTTQTGGVKPGEEVEKSPLEQFVEDNPDEDLVPAKVQLEERKFQETRQQKAQAARERAEQAEREKQEKQYRQSQAVKALTTKAEQSEAEFRKAHDDYENVTKPIVEAGLLTDAERLEFLKDANPAQKFYDICKAKGEALRGVLGKTTTPVEETTKKSAPTTPEGETNAAEDEDLTDEQIFEEIYPDHG